MENYSISNVSRVFHLKVSLSLAATPNNSGLLIECNCNMIPVWTLCAVDSRRRVTQLNLIRLVVLLLQYTLHLISVHTHRHSSNHYSFTRG